MSLLSLGVAIFRNKEEEEVGSRAVPRGAHAAIFSNALKRFTGCLEWLNVCYIHKQNHMCLLHVCRDCMCLLNMLWWRFGDELNIPLSASHYDGEKEGEEGMLKEEKEGEKEWGRQRHKWTKYGWDGVNKNRAC